MDKVFGDRALLTKEKRSYNAIAHQETLMLVLSKNDYNDQVFHLEQRQRKSREAFLSTVPYI